MILFLTLLLRQLLVPRQPTIEICCFVLCTLIPDITFIICFDGKVLQQFYSFCVLASILLPDSGHLFKSQEKIFMIPRNFLGGGSSSRKSKILESQLWSQNQNKMFNGNTKPCRGEHICLSCQQRNLSQHISRLWIKNNLWPYTKYGNQRQFCKPCRNHLRRSLESGAFRERSAGCFPEQRQLILKLFSLTQVEDSPDSHKHSSSLLTHSRKRLRTAMFLIKSRIYTVSFVSALDNYSLYIFPAGFALFNVVYWLDTFNWI